MVDFGKLTEEETAELAGEALAQLTVSARVKVVMAAFAEGDERDELLSHLDETEGE